MCSIIWDDLPMQGRARADRDLWDAGDITGSLVPPGSVFAFLAGHRRELFPDSFTADLFRSGTGRPSLPADLIGSVLVLKELYALSDTQAADALKFDLRWKVACGRSLLQTSFDPSALVYWRRRIAASQRPDRVFDAVAEVIALTGILRGRRKRCVDSTVFDDAVATQDTVTQLVAAIRRVARVAGGAAQVIAQVCQLDYSRPGKPPIDWDDPQAKEALVSDLVNDALAVLEALTGPDAPERDAAAADALGLLALVAGQDVEPAEDSDGTDGRWRIARKVAPDRVISTVDQEARHTRKCKSKRRDGFRGHVAAEPETGLITDCEMTMATGPGSTDAENGVKMAGRDRFHSSPAAAADGDAGVPEQPQGAGVPEQPAAQMPDRGWPGDGSPAGPAPGPATAAAEQENAAAGGRDDAEPQAGAGADAGPDAVPDPPRSARNDAGPGDEQAGPGAGAREAGDGNADADADARAGAPAGTGAEAEQGTGLEVYGDSAYGSGEARAAYRDGGHDTFIKPGPLRPAVPCGFTIDDFAVDEEQGTVTCPNGVTRPMSAARTVTFGAACAGCPLRAQCTTAKDGRSMTIHPHEGLLRAARARASTEEFRQAYPTRSNIERTIAWTATQDGRRVRLRYIGTSKNDAWLHTRCAGLNLRTLVKAGLTRRGGAWALA
jgi:hypothetical protein